MTRHNRKRKVDKRPPKTNANIGTAIIHSLVSNSETREEDRAALMAIKDSVWHYLNSPYNQDDKTYWAIAGMLAAYNLGKLGLKSIPIAKKKVETP